MPEIESRISGIPCIINVTYFRHQKPLGPTADSDWDCWGYTEMDFEVLDRRGRKAPWLQRKMTDDDIRRIENEIMENRE